ncbi:hypothetical protein BKN38_04380 [Helicobacter sp. CLO-3]|nr:hypothetical protein BA723_01040 [Helicobacter sp. CLO-3]OHU84037.1 hypothetical protein BKN38_04380 [Helicobacter sp. CLO-3]
MFQKIVKILHFVTFWAGFWGGFAVCLRVGLGGFWARLALGLRWGRCWLEAGWWWVVSGLALFCFGIASIAFIASIARAPNAYKIQ